MITVKQVLENYNIITEKASNDTKNLAALVHAGLLDESKLPILNRALSKSANMMTEAEKKALQGLVESLASCVISEQQDHLSKLDTSRPMSYPSEKEIPTVLILKRKAIRVYPDNQKVALYYCQALDRYISVPYGKNAKNLGMVMNEENLNEISQELATRAYAKRYAQIKNIEKDETLSPENKTISSNLQKQKLVKLSQRMMTNVADKQSKGLTPKQLRPWAGKDAVKTAIEAGKIRAKEQPKITNDQINKMSASERAGAGVKPTQAMKAALSSGSPGSVGGAIGIGLRGMVGLDKPKPPVPVKESFRKHLEEKRQEKLDEVSWEDIKDGAKKAAEIAGDVTGVNDVVSAVGKAREGDYSGAAWDAAKGVGKGLLTVGTGGAVGAAVTGARVGLTALKAGRSVGNAARRATVAARTSRGGKIAGGIARGVKNVAKGAAGAGALAAGALSGAAGAFDDVSKPTEQNRPGFGGSLGGAKVAGETKTGMSAADTAALRQQVRGWNQQPQSPAVRESNNNLTVMKQIVEQNIPSHTIYISETPITINKRVAKKVMTVYESLNRQNKKKIEKMLNEDAVSFKKVINFAIRQ
jgi:hypothetical protein